MIAIIFTQIDPVIFHIIGPIALRWYGLAYILGIIFSIWFISKLSKKSLSLIINKKIADDMIFHSAIGIIIGGRIGYVLFYDIAYYINHPIDIIKIWEGGMSFHGGFIGLLISLYLLCKKHKIVFLELTDLISCTAPIGLFFGRIANFINGELIGRTTEVPWGMIFPNVDNLVRHPSQLYEAFLEGILLFIIMSFLRKTISSEKEGTLSAYFLILYGILRSIAELFREPDQHIGFIAKYLTLGQVLCLPFILAGLLLIYKLKLCSNQTTHL